MLIQKKRVFAIFLSMLFFNHSFSYEWKALEFFSSQEASKLQSSHFIDLKKQVKKYLKNSWCSSDKAEMLMDLTYILEPQYVVEIGVFSGSTTLPIVAVLKYLDKGMIYSVDAWSCEKAVDGISTSDANYLWWSSLDMQAVFEEFIAMLKFWKLEKFCTVVSKDSIEAVNLVPDAIDFLHLDGNFSEKNALQDAELYLPKVKKGGYILLSNACYYVDHKRSKDQTFLMLYESCDFVYAVDDGNAALFQKR